MDGEAAHFLGQTRGARDIDEQHEALLLDGRMIAAGGEIKERTRADDVDHRDREIHHDRECRRRK